MPLSVFTSFILLPVWFRFKFKHYRKLYCYLIAIFSFDIIYFVASCPLNFPQWPKLILCALKNGPIMTSIHCTDIWPKKENKPFASAFCFEKCQCQNKNVGRASCGLFKIGTRPICHQPRQVVRGEGSSFFSLPNKKKLISNFQFNFSKYKIINFIFPLSFLQIQNFIFPNTKFLI